MGHLILWSTIVLSVVILGEGIAVRHIVHRLALLYASLDEVGERLVLASGVPAPRFRASTLTPRKIYRLTQSQGYASILFFVTPSDNLSELYASLGSVLHALWHRVEGHLYIVCRGDTSVCGRFVSKDLSGFPRDKVLLDEKGNIARRFRIFATPRAVEIDPQLNVKRYGEPFGDTPSSGEPKDMSDRERLWPDDRPITGAGFARVDSTISCVLSRFHLTSFWSLFRFYLAFREIRRNSRNIEGLLHSVFLLEDPRTFYTLSFWRYDWAIAEFGSVRSHIGAANAALAATYDKHLQRSVIWSAQFRLWGVSRHNYIWDKLDLPSILGDKWPTENDIHDSSLGRE